MKVIVNNFEDSEYAIVDNEEAYTFLTTLHEYNDDYPPFKEVNEETERVILEAARI